MIFVLLFISSSCLLLLLLSLLRRSPPGPSTTSAVWINGARYTAPSSDTGIVRGHFFTVINQVTGQVEEMKTFDTHGDSTADEDIEAWVDSIEQGRIVVLALHDSGGIYEHVASLLSLMQGHDFDADFSLRESFCLVGRKGKVSTHWMTRNFNPRFVRLALEDILFAAFFCLALRLQRALRTA